MERTNVYLSPSQVERLDALVPAMLEHVDAEPRVLGGRVTRSAVMRAALERGLVELEAELGLRKGARRT